MKNFSLLMMVVFSSSSYANHPVVLNDPTPLQWKNRLIIVNEPQKTDSVLALIKANNDEINDRDIVWFIFDNKEVLTNYTGRLSARFTYNTKQMYLLGEDTVTLIGKDSGLKSQQSQINLPNIFSQIDAMPMRQREMRERK
ncbi:DUF4174 domain-containing protein [Marinomonas sp. C2222]|uniref:DUF4174 domain-containing protein n=1 Tax=Marinomonas sargassi TaxID=2984494 RepID=A0ABT2YRJ5_9GAMM|nr:DUF4174 domain-containing protein [Marinomonas sargassi]MCV2402505.1 DUF4174 domain-containing protein [Marinomonas sargassi]